MESLAFYLPAIVAVAMGVGVVACRSPLRSALCLIVTQCALAALFITLSAPFVAAMQVLVYAGAIMVLFLFVIMLLNLGPDSLPASSYLALAKTGGAAAGLWLSAVAGWLALGRPLSKHAVDGSVRHVGELLLGQNVVAFEAISVLLLTASLGAIVLGLKRLT